MVLLIAGASHTGKTLLAQGLLERYGYPYLSIDHLKMGLIRSGQTRLTPMSGTGELTAYLWPIVREMIKTAIESGQNLIVEGCYIPFDWRRDFGERCLRDIRYRCLIMSEAYIRARFSDIKGFANAVETRLEDSDCTMETLLRDNGEALRLCRAHGLEYIWIDGAYPVGLDELAFPPEGRELG